MITFIICSYILNARFGFSLPWPTAYIGGLLFSAFIIVCTYRKGKRVTGS